MSYQHLDLKQRYVIAALLREGATSSRIAELIGRDPRTVDREIVRNRCDDGSYEALKAHERSEQRRRLASVRPSAVTEAMKQHIRTDLKNGLSPEQITGRRRRQGPAPGAADGLARDDLPADLWGAFQSAVAGC